MSESTLAAIGLLTILVNAGIAVYQTRAGRRKDSADAASALSAAASGLVEQLRAELDRKQNECDEKMLAQQAQIERQSAEIGKAQEQLVALGLRVDELAGVLRVKDQHLAIASHQLRQAGLKPLWETP